MEKSFLILNEPCLKKQKTKKQQKNPQQQQQEKEMYFLESTK